MINPGQILACCGLLELAHRLWPGAEGWFEGRNFCVRVSDKGAGLSDLMKCLLETAANPGEIHGTIRDFRGKPVDPKKVIPIQLAAPLNLRLAWWLDELGSAFTPLKLWSGRQSSWEVFRKLREVGSGQMPFDESLLDLHHPLKSRFGVDPRSAWEASSTGFSPNTLGMTVATYWATELLAAIALASCVPQQLGNQYQFSYATWSQPLPPLVARVAVTGALPVEGRRQFRFDLITRGSFDGFGFATPIGDQI
jgi:CRISPR-associated protein Csx14